MGSYYGKYKGDIQTLCFGLLESNTNYNDAYKTVNDKFPMSARNFCRYWKEAKEHYATYIGDLYTSAVGKKKKETVKKIQEQPVTKYRVLQACMMVVEKGKDRDRIQALRLICDIEGYKAPIKQDVTLTAITPVFAQNPLLDNIIDVTPSK